MLCFCCTLIICMGHSKLESIILLHFLLDLTLLWLNVILFHEVCHILRDHPWSHANKVLYNSSLHVYFLFVDTRSAICMIVLVMYLWKRHQIIHVDHWGITFILQVWLNSTLDLLLLSFVHLVLQVLEFPLTFFT